jgi:hypothetical protein
VAGAARNLAVETIRHHLNKMLLRHQGTPDNRIAFNRSAAQGLLALTARKFAVEPACMVIQQMKSGNWDAGNGGSNNGSDDGGNSGDSAVINSPTHRGTP